MTLIKIVGASAANGYEGESNRPPPASPEEIARRAAAQARAAQGGGALAPVINPELLRNAGTMNRLHAEQRADGIMRGVAANQQRVGDIMGAADLSRIDWPEQAYYGWEHARDVSQLAVHIAQGGKATVGSDVDLTNNDIDVIKAAGLFHDLGRTEEWTKPSPGHRFASAERARKLMIEDAQAWFRRDLIDEVCRLITQHVMPSVDPDGRLRDPDGSLISHVEPPTDPRLRCLWDAESFEGMRFEPGTWEGSVVLKARLAHVCTPWAKVAEHQRRWREKKGWT
jgi:hypothetical protein